MKQEGKKTLRQRLADKKVRQQLNQNGPRKAEFLRLLLNMMNRYVTVLIIYVILLFPSSVLPISHRPITR